MRGDLSNLLILKEAMNHVLAGGKLLLNKMKKKTPLHGMNLQLENLVHIIKEARAEEMTQRIHQAMTLMTPEAHQEAHQEVHQEVHQMETQTTTSPEYSEEGGEDPQEEDHLLTHPGIRELNPKGHSPLLNITLTQS